MLAQRVAWAGCRGFGQRWGSSLGNPVEELGHLNVSFDSLDIGRTNTGSGNKGCMEHSDSSPYLHQVASNTGSAGGDLVGAAEQGR